MKSYWMHIDDVPNPIELRDAPMPVAGPTQALVKVHAAGLNRGEFIKGHGLHGSQGAKAIGMEAAGEIVAIGDKVGAIARRKVGYLVCSINNGAVSVVIESKMDASVAVGDPTALDERNKKSGNPEKSAYGQNITALVNRGAQMAICVFDKESLSASLRGLEDVTFQPELPGFIVKIDRARGDFARNRPSL